MSNMEENKLPQFFIDMLNNQYGQDLTKQIIKGYSLKRVTTLRVNTLKANIEKIKQELLNFNIEFEDILWYKDALLIKNATEKEIQELEIYKNGEIYMQSLSSMLPPIILEPKENKDILDMAAAPGGKTTQIAAITQNKAHITACEMNAIRAERLKYNIQKQGANVFVMREDARKINDLFSFDQILLDAPCSGSGTININDENLEKTFTQKLIDKCVSSQTQLLKKALKILKPGNELVYSTCSILQQENEDIILNAIKGTNAKIVPIEFEGKSQLPLLPSKIDGALCVMPNEYYEGFFICKIRK